MAKRIPKLHNTQINRFWMHVGVSEATVSYVVNGGRWQKFTGGK